MTATMWLKLRDHRRVFWHAARRAASRAQIGHVTDASSLPRCMCDCGDPDADRCQLLPGPPPGAPWPQCICPYCGPEPARDGVQRRCTTLVHPIVLVITGGVILCEECRDSCARRMREEAERARQDSHDAKRACSTPDAEAPDQPAGTRKK